jgi:hypothetical protein
MSRVFGPKAPEPPRSLARVLLMVAALVPWIILFLFLLPGLTAVPS